MIDKRLIAVILLVLAIIFYKWVAILIALLVLLVLLLIVWEMVRRQYWLRVRGYWVEHAGRDSFRYEERHGGGVERLTIGGERMLRAPHVVYVPSEEKWQKSKPDWAQGRREEIIGRVKSFLGSKKYEYVEPSRRDA